MRRELPDLAAVSALGRDVAAKLRRGDVVALEGDLGAGKTTLARAVIEAAGHRGEVPSPTFTIIEPYEALDPPIVHADFYRLETSDELEEIGLDDYREGAVLLAEWPDRAGGFAHEPPCLTIRLQKSDGARFAIVEGGADWQGRMP